MNRAHISHYTFNPDPGIRYVLPGWGEDGVPAQYDLTVDDVWLRNVTTNVRGGFGQSGELQRDMNSIFVFEVSGLCIAHLGHLHHTLTKEHLDALGRIDVVLAPVDGGYTLNVDDMIEVLGQINAPLVIPMHYFGTSTLARFVARLEEHYAVETNPLPVVTLSPRDAAARAYGAGAAGILSARGSVTAATSEPAPFSQHSAAPASFSRARVGSCRGGLGEGAHRNGDVRC